MKLLAFDTSTELMQIAVQKGDQVWTHEGTGGALASANLIPAIQALMAQADLQFANLDAIVFGRGPGSFTGLRTACSVAQGLAFGAGVKVLPIDTLMAVAEEARYLAIHAAGASAGSAGMVQPTRICAALDARMGEMYHAYYYFNSCLRSIDAGYSLKTPSNMLVLHDFEDTLLAGNVQAAYGAQLPVAVQAAPYVQCLPTARALLRLAPALMAAGGLVDPEDALPLYIRDKVAQTTAEREALTTAHGASPPTKVAH